MLDRAAETLALATCAPAAQTAYKTTSGYEGQMKGTWPEHEDLDGIPCCSVKVAVWNSTDKV